MSLYEVNAKCESFRELLKGIEEEISNDELKGMLIVVIKKDDSAELRQIEGDTDTFQWLGILEYVKDTLKDG